MLLYFAKRLLLTIPVLWVVATLVFFLIRLIPGNPVDYYLGEQASQVDRTALIQAQNLDKPLLEQYGIYLKNIVSGKLGTSYFTQEPVGKMIANRFPATLQLATASLFWALLISIPWGVYSALQKGKWTDKLSLVVSLLGVSIPGFYLGPLLILLFSLTLNWLPVSGREMPGSLILPSLTLGVSLSALLIRFVRSSVLEVLPLDYVRTARAKGLPKRKVLFKHALRTALIPVVAILGLQFGTLLAGAIVTEKIFAWPGLGSLMLEAISRRDYSVVQGCILVIATTYAMVNLVTDMVYVKVDPRIRLE